MLAKVACLLLLAVCSLAAQGPGNVLVVVNDRSSLSRSVGDYYVLHRHVPIANVCHLQCSENEEISRQEFTMNVATPIARFLLANNLRESVLYIVTTAGVPLRIAGTEGLSGDTASVDSELTLLYSDLRTHGHRIQGPLRNPFFGQSTTRFQHPQFPIYLVTRLAGYDFADIRGLVDRALAATNRGKFLIDLKQYDSTEGNEWLRDAAIKLPENRVVVDDSKKVLSSEKDVIGYASWGSNDPDRKQRDLGMQWLPGAIMTEYVSSNGRTFIRPPDSWTLGKWGDPKTYYAGSPQSLSADYIHSGVTGASGHVSEPYLQFTPRPDLLLPAYYRGRNLAESYYLALPVLSWQNIVIGDPLCSLGKP